MLIQCKRRAALAFLFALLAGCAAHVTPRLQPSGLRTRAGQDVATALQVRFDDPAVDCGGHGKPAFLCSGLVLRGTTASSGYHSWNPSPKDQVDGGVSFSWLRRDASFRKLAYGYTHGYVLYPILTAPKDKFDIEVLCAFPIDGDTDIRSQHGCGPSTLFPTDSGPCQMQNPPITTAPAWHAHYMKPGISPRQEHGCAFDVSDDATDTAAIFHQVPLSMQLLGATSFNEQNELILATWPQNSHAGFPVQAFFYVTGSPQGLEGARFEQRDFASVMPGAFVPIVRLTLPTTQGGPGRIAYEDADQAVSP